jgi:GT2 family glycosyltransferase
MDKIGLGIVTHKREDYFKQVIQTIPFDKIDFFVIVNDGTPYDLKSYFGKHESVIQNETNLGVGKTKNKAIQFLMDKGCDHIFIMEDDILIQSPQVFEKYIEASKVIGIQHFNFALHGPANRDSNYNPSPLVTLKHEGVEFQLYQACVGAFSYYSKLCIEKVGLMDENFFNASEHVEHTYQIIKAGMHPPFWTFADIKESDKYLQEIENSIQESSIGNRSDFLDCFYKASDYFKSKHGIIIRDIPQSHISEVLKSLNSINENFV